jgi:tryptophan-rich sensory protein
MPASVWFHVLTPVVLSALVNAHVYVSNSNDRNSGTASSAVAQKLLPPGYVIGIVWTIIFALLGYAHYRVFPSIASFVIVAALAYCLAYPYLTMFKSAPFQRATKFLNTLSLIVAALVAAATVAKDTVAFVAALPLLAWASYVNLVDAIECQSH